MKKKLLAAVVGLNTASFAVQAAPSAEEMWQLIQQQQEQIRQLQAQLEKTATRVQETELKTEATIAAVEEVTSGPAGKVADWAERTTIGGYGELHYNNLERDDSSSEKDEMDLHRFVLFFGHRFNEKVRFFSELEVEHSIAGEGKEGEVEMEQAFIEWDYAHNHRARAGLFLVPVGILNETHEPNTFYGVERNNVEKNIIPSTWWEGGVGFNGQLAEGFSYDLAVHSGLFLDPTKPEFKVRDGRQKVSKAKSDDLAYTGRLKYTGIPGLELAATVQYQSDLLQGESFGTVDDIDGLLFEAHAAYRQGPFGLRALYAQWDMDNGINVISDGADEQSGYYVEPSWLINDKLGVFARYSEWDNRAGSSVDSEVEQFDLGLNYWLAENVVLKVDYQNQDAENDKGDDGFNLGVGWSF